jgi:hypothetical protein
MLICRSAHARTRPVVDRIYAGSADRDTPLRERLQGLGVAVPQWPRAMSKQAIRRDLFDDTESRLGSFAHSRCHKSLRALYAYVA